MKAGKLHLRRSVWLRRSESGQALVELAFILPVLLLLLLGGGEIARLAYAAIEVSNAARAGAQYGTQTLTTMGDHTGIQLAAQSDASNLTGLITTTETYSYVCSDQSAYDAATQSCTDGASVLTYLHVTTTASYNPLIHIPGTSGSYTLTGRSVMECLYQ